MKNPEKLVVLAASLLLMVVFSTGFTIDAVIDITATESDTESKTEFNLEEVSDQVWAVQVEADPGEDGQLSQEFEAAHGPYDEDFDVETEEEVNKDAFGFGLDEDGYFEVLTGEDYVGDYFKIDQKASTTGGTTKRYIDISSQWTGGYLYEDMVVEGTAEITESFHMDNVKPGEEAVPEWHDLF